MSNTEAATIYAAIIEDVIAESRQDFENSGIDEATLQDLRKIWMEKLVVSQCADFPWAQQQTIENDGAEDVNSLALHTTTAANGGGYTSQVQQQQQQQQQPLPILTPTISDLGSSASGMEYPTISTSSGTKEEDTGLVLPTGGRIVNQGDGNFEITIDVDNKDDALKYMAELKRRNNKKIRLTQTDGLNDDDDDDDDENDDDDQLKDDGFGSDDINSDLDDSDSLESEDDSDDQEGNIMLCLYDKVQRVKNKWKCNLKEGVASLNGKDYTFQKATSESEW